ncbi:hypothetical protein EV363DRAFT_1379702 [Boletus edulis]|nr:hypothetical protein EV363DRAFT_1379702 [Boletus edulis]
MANHGCWTIEYDWMVSLGSEPQSRETVLCVLFEDGAQRQFSSVRITLLYSSDTTPQHHHTWKIKPYSPPLSVVSRVPFESQDTFVTPNDPSLPICNIVFTANRHSARSQTISGVAKDCGELVLTETGPPKDFHNIMFEFDQPLAENTESVSVSFTSSRLLCTMITHGVFSDPPSDHSTIVGRVVRVFPVDPASKRRTISLPTDVLLLVFENLRFPPTYRGWRKDVLSSALVCREWTCALNALLADFRSEESQQGYPPEICRFASGLVARPSLGLGIKYLSLGYLEKHPSWDPLPDFPPGRLSTMFLAKLQLRQGNPRRSQFGKALLSILSVAKNVQTLCLDPGMDLVVASDDLADTLCGLNKLETFEGRCPLTMAQLVSCVATWPSLKRLSIVNVLPPVDHTLPLASPSCCLTVLELSDIPIKDDELICFVSASGATLEQLTLSRISRLTNAGLGAALNAVCTSLTSLYIMSDALVRSPGEEHALDATITRMERLTMLKIVPDVASERMVERRAEAFKQRSTPALSEVHLHLLMAGEPEDHSLIAAASRVWPGWEMAQTGWAAALGIPSLYL